MNNLISFRPTLLGPVLLAAAFTLAGPTVYAADSSRGDPFGTEKLTAPGRGLPWTGGADACLRVSGAVARTDSTGDSPLMLTLADIIDQALCNNPQTRQAWATARVQAAEVGRNRAAFLPQLDISASANSNNTWPISGASTRLDGVSASATLSYLLFDSGERDANLENARQLLEAANWSHSAILQTVFLSAIQSYYQLFGARANAVAAAESERASLEILKSAEFRYSVGTGTPADRLQAQTAYSQARLTRTRAEGEERNAAGVLANAIGLDADARLEIAVPRIDAPDPVTDARLRELVDYARMLRPDLAAAEAKLRAARAQVRAYTAAGRPTIALTGTAGIGNNSSLDTYNSGTIGISVNFPLFTGYRNTYEIRGAEAQVEARGAERDQLRNQVSLDVWRAYQSLATERTALVNAEDLLRSALESENVARGRYRAGAGTLIDLLNAQSAAANARFQQIQAQYNWHLAKAALASAIGALDLAALSASADTVRIDTSRSAPGK